MEIKRDSYLEQLKIIDFKFCVENIKIREVFILCTWI